MIALSIASIFTAREAAAEKHYHLNSKINWTDEHNAKPRRYAPIEIDVVNRSLLKKRLTGSLPFWVISPETIEQSLENALEGYLLKPTKGGSADIRKLKISINIESFKIKGGSVLNVLGLQGVALKGSISLQPIGDLSPFSGAVCPTYNFKTKGKKTAENPRDAFGPAVYDVVQDAVNACWEYDYVPYFFNWDTNLAGHGRSPKPLAPIADLSAARARSDQYWSAPYQDAKISPTEDGFVLTDISETGYLASLGVPNGTVIRKAELAENGTPRFINLLSILSYATSADPELPGNLEFDRVLSEKSAAIESGDETARSNYSPSQIDIVVLNAMRKAGETGNTTLISSLVKNGDAIGAADLDLNQPISGVLPLSVAIEASQISSTDEAADLRRYSILNAYAWDVLYPGTVQDPIFSAVAVGDPNLVAQLVALGSDPRATTESGVSVLMIASGQKNAATVETLISAGADVTASDQNGRSALHYAYDNGGYALSDNQRTTIGNLIAAGSDVNAVDSYGFSARQSYDAAVTRTINEQRRAREAADRRAAQRAEERRRQAEEDERLAEEYRRRQELERIRRANQPSMAEVFLGTLTSELNQYNLETQQARIREQRRQQEEFLRNESTKSYSSSSGSSSGNITITKSTDNSASNAEIQRRQNEARELERAALERSRNSNANQAPPPIEKRPTCTEVEGYACGYVTPE